MPIVFYPSRCFPALPLYMLEYSQVFYHKGVWVYPSTYIESDNLPNISVPHSIL